MAFKLLNPVHTTMPFFQPNQVLTYQHLNDMADFLFQQERYTRNKLIGTGIVCGLSFDWNTLGVNAEVVIQEGCAITSAGYLMVYTRPVENNAVVTYTHRRNYTGLDQYIPFNDPSVLTNETIYELITLGQFNAEAVAPKSQLLEADRVNRVLILLYEIDPKDTAKCLDENCDDKGKTYIFTPRPLLVPISVINSILDANSTKTFHTETGRGWKGINSKLQGPPANLLTVPNLFSNGFLQTITTAAQMKQLVTNKITNAYLDGVGQTIDALVNAFPWVFSTQMASMTTDHPWITAPPASNIGNRFATLAKAFRNNAAFDNYIQYLYDYSRDVADAYNDLYQKTTDLIGECGGNEYQHPFHIMLGKAQNNDDSKKWYSENKYLNPAPQGFRYRHYFVPSPVMDTQFMLYEEVQQLLLRLTRMIDTFTVNPQETFIKVSPSKDYENPIEVRALPYYYRKADAAGVRAVWNYGSTRRNKILQHKGYQLVSDNAAGQDELLALDGRATDFYRIEGHMNTNVDAATLILDNLRNQFNLPFNIASASVQTGSNTKVVSCHFPDLDEDFNYYRDRVLGYMREYLIILEPFAIPLFQNIISHIKDMMSLLLEVRCLKDFDYDKYKLLYAQIYMEWVKALGNEWQNNPGDANQGFNQTQNLLNIIFFCPIYRIWYSYLYRTGILTETELEGVQELAKKVTGWEHLAGVRRGETFLMVYDANQNKQIIADFNLPDLDHCSCGCKTNPCDNKTRSLVPPLEKPVIMVVDLANTNTSGRDLAYWVQNKAVFRLELDSMGFYKGDSMIDQDFLISFDSQGQNPVPYLKGAWVSNLAEGHYFQVDLNPKDPNVKPGVYLFYYFLKGNFASNFVKGILLLVIKGKISANGSYNINIAVGTKAKVYYPYATADYKGEEVKLSFTEDYTIRTVQGQQAQVYTTPLGNQVALLTDKKKQMVFYVNRARIPELTEIPYLMTAKGNSIPGTLILNVYDKDDAPADTTVKGTILDEKGKPVSEATVRLGEKEVYTDEKGNYSIKGAKAGTAIEVEMDGYKTKRVQANSKMEGQIQLEKEKTESAENSLLDSAPLLKEWISKVDISALIKVFNP